MFYKKKIDEINTKVNDLDEEVSGYEQLFCDVFESINNIKNNQNIDRELVLDLVFALAIASGTNPNNFAKSVDSDKMSKYVEKFNNKRNDLYQEKIKGLIDSIKNKNNNKNKPNKGIDKSKK